MSGRYKPGLYLSVVGFMMLGGIFIISLPEQVQQAKKKQDYLAAVDLEKTRLGAITELNKERSRLQRQVAETANENEVMLSRTFKVWGYLDNKLISPKLNLEAFPDNDEMTFIYDARDRCLGFVRQRRFYSKNAKGGESICTLANKQLN